MENTQDELTRANENCQVLLNRLLSFCINLVRFNSQSELVEPTGLATGFIVQVKERKYVLTAGHVALQNTTWYWETPLINRQLRNVLQIPIKPFFSLKKRSISGEESDVDFAWCDFSCAKKIFQDECQKYLSQGGKREDISEPLFYTDSLDVSPIPQKEPYTFAAWNRATIMTCGTSLLKRESSYETNMVYVGDDSSGLYKFKLARRHQGDDYYKGASGAPIAATDGSIVSMVLGGIEKENVILGLPLANYSGLISTSATIFENNHLREMILRKSL